MNGNAYLSKFLETKCCGDILNVVSPLHNAPKEITESMSFITRLRDVTLENKMKFNIVDLCAGNALTSITSVFLLPIKEAIAIDKYKRYRKYHEARRFQYIEGDIYTDEPYKYINEDTIIISVHPCRELAKRVVDIFNNSPSRLLYLMPCCMGKYEMSTKPFLIEQMGQYYSWCFYLASLCNGSIAIDKHCISERNAVITAKK